jgi:hypothetical protein
MAVRVRAEDVFVLKLEKEDDDEKMRTVNYSSY